MSKLTLFILVALTGVAVGQPNTGSPAVEEIVRRAADQRVIYLSTFKNLLSHETKTFEIFDRNGSVKKRRVVRSNFIVYQLIKAPDKITEYRNVYSVDGKDLGGTEQRAQEFFEKVQSVESSAKELERITDESQRFDEELFISNMTLFQAVALSDPLRPSFEFKLVGREVLDGRAAYVLEFRQKASTPGISVAGRARGSSDGLKYDVDLDGIREANERLAGKLWIDTETFQVMREHRVLTVQPEGFHVPVTLSENTFEFQSSSFGIMTPLRIQHLQFDIDRKKRISRRGVQVLYVYERFTRPDVDVKASDVTHP